MRLPGSAGSVCWHFLGFSAHRFLSSLHTDRTRYLSGSSWRDSTHSVYFSVNSVFPQKKEIMKFSLTKLWGGSYNLPNSLIKLSIKPVSVPPAMPGPRAM